MRVLFASLFAAVMLGSSGASLAQEQAAPPAGDDRIIIFFAWDRPVIDGDASARLDELVAALRSDPTVRLSVAGHADRSGPSAANVTSGRLRAEAVRAYLAARGVPEAAMQIVSHGEAQPLIATADGVREPQNRRVEVTRLPPGA